MRDRLFKAKRLDNGEWVEGYLIDDDCGCFIIPKDSINERQRKDNHYGHEIILLRGYEVDATTICQYTGKRDWKHCETWENDIVYEGCNGLIGKVIWYLG